MLTQEEANSVFEIKDGKIFYRPRTMTRGRPSVLAGVEAGCDSGHGYRRISYKKKKYYAHQLVFLMIHGYIPALIDHIDGNGCNNDIANLRECDKAKNNHNSKMPVSNKSGVKNVFWRNQINKWQCVLVVNKKRIYCGTFDDLELAELVAYEAREKYHGKFANHGVVA